MKNVLIASTIVLTISAPAFAEQVKANVEDHYKTVLQQTPYNVEVCRDVQVPYGSKKEMDTGGAIIGGLIGGVIGNQIGKGGGKDAATGIGAITGAIIGGQQNSGPQGYTTQRHCELVTRYKETETTVYSHSTISFYHNGQKQVVKFSK